MSDYDEITRMEREENMMKSSKKLTSVFDVTLNPKKQDQKTVSSRDMGYSKATFQGSLGPGENIGKGQVKGKVKEFVRVFNQEAVTKPSVHSKSRPQDSTYKQKEALTAKNNVSVVTCHS